MEQQNQNKLRILYASQTGNAVDAAERLGREAERRRCSASVLSVDEFDPNSLPFEENVIFVVSTTGQGDPPDSMKGFWRFLLQRNLSKEWLKGVNYAVFGLGDSSYQKYNFVAKKLDKRLLDLGASAIIERGLGDDQHTSGYEGALDPWMSTLWNTLYEKNPSLFPSGPKLETSDMNLMDQPKVQIIYHDVGEEDSQYSIVNGDLPLNTLDVEYHKIQFERTRSMSPGKFSGTNRPDCFLKMMKNEPLSIAGCGKDVRHFEFEAVSSPRSCCSGCFY